MSLFDLMAKNDEEKTRPNKKRKSTHQRTTKRSISCDSNASSEDSDIECYSSFVQPAKRRTTKTKHRDQNNNNNLNNPFDENVLSDHDNSCESLFIEENSSFFPSSNHQQHTFAEILGQQTEMENGLPVQRIAKRDAPTPFQHFDKRRMNPAEISEALFNMKADLMTNIESLGRNLPANTLDELIDQLGGPSQVAEVSSNALFSCSPAFRLVR